MIDRVDILLKRYFFADLFLRATLFCVFKSNSDIWLVSLVISLLVDRLLLVDLQLLRLLLRCLCSLNVWVRDLEGRTEDARRCDVEGSVLFARGLGEDDLVVDLDCRKVMDSDPNLRRGGGATGFVEGG